MPETIKLEDIEDELSTLNVTSDEDCLMKLRELCFLHKQTAEDIVELWVAYSYSNGNCSLNPQQLDYFKKDFLKKELNKSNSKQDKLNESTNRLSNSQPFKEEMIIDAYLTPDAKKQKVQFTPDGIRKKSLMTSKSPSFSPSSFSPISGTPSTKYKSRLSSCEIVSKFGDTENTNWICEESTAKSSIKITHVGDHVIKGNYPYMYEKLRNKATILNDLIDDVTDVIVEEQSVEYISSVKSPQSNEVTVAGKISCDGNGRLNQSSILLDGSSATSKGASVSVNVSNLSQYSLFPGQIAGFSGVNNSGTSFVAKKILLPSPCPFFNNDILKDNSVLQVAIACGPFTTKDSLSYEPFYDFINYVIEHRPNICILIGPFLDSRNGEIEKGKVNEKYEDIFEKVLKNMCDMTESIETQFILVPSQRDVHGSYIYPTPPFSSEFLKSNPRLHLVSDPSMLKINGVVFGITSADILLHLGKEEIWFPSNSIDRLKRLASHLLNQRSFYPLFPPAEEMNIDYEKAEMHANFTVTPHVLIIPSDLKNFIKDVNGCCCVNPERLTKGTLGGTFCRMQINFSSNSESIMSKISAEILRI